MPETLRVYLSSDDLRTLAEEHNHGRPLTLPATDGTRIELAPWNPDNTED